MATHTVEMKDIPALEVGIADVVFNINADSKKLGSLRMSRGKIIWVPANKTRGHGLSWGKFGEMMVANGKERKVGF